MIEAAPKHIIDCVVFIFNLEDEMIRNLQMGLALLASLMAPMYASADPLRSCDNKSLHGNYGYRLTGETVVGGQPGPRAAVGRFSADGHGNVTGTETKSQDGTILTGLTFTGSYNILTDCTGTGAVTISDGETRNFNFVIVEDDGLIAIQTDPGRIVTITATKQKDS